MALAQLSGLRVAAAPEEREEKPRRSRPVLLWPWGGSAVCGSNPVLTVQPLTACPQFHICDFTLAESLQTLAEWFHGQA